MKKIYIVGAGGFGREVYDWAKETFSEKKYTIVGFLDDNLKLDYFLNFFLNYLYNVYKAKSILNCK